MVSFEFPQHETQGKYIEGIGRVPSREALCIHTELNADEQCEYLDSIESDGEIAKLLTLLGEDAYNAFLSSHSAKRQMKIQAECKRHINELLHMHNVMGDRQWTDIPEFEQALTGWSPPPISKGTGTENVGILDRLESLQEKALGRSHSNRSLQHHIAEVELAVELDDSYQ